MKILLPQEIDVWYVLPFIRKELATILKQEHKQSQKDIACMLGITEAAVSQYLHAKRAQTIDIPPETLAELKDAAQQLVDGESFLKISTTLLNSKQLVKLKCDMHRQMDKSLPAKCDVCMR